MSEHTPGPWINEEFSLSNEIRALANPLIAVVQSRHCDSPEELRSNARLIAAAPELLDVVEEIYREFGGQLPQRFGDMMRDTIAKAKGADPTTQDAG